jgi:hypothetical protein
MTNMDFESIEREALRLDARDSARLAQELLDSIDYLSPAEIDAGDDVLVSGDEVAREVHALLR